MAKDDLKPSPDAQDSHIQVSECDNQYWLAQCRLIVLENPDVYTSDSNRSWYGNDGIPRSVCKATIITGNSFLTWLGCDMQQESRCKMHRHVLLQTPDWAKWDHGVTKSNEFSLNLQNAPKDSNWSMQDQAHECKKRLLRIERTWNSNSVGYRWSSGHTFTWFHAYRVET